jgi:hypothetical protein
MTGKAAAAARMAKGRQADSGRRRERVLNALAEMARSGEVITVSALAKRAGVDRSFLYRHPDLLAQVHASAVQPSPGGATAPSRASLQADLLAANDRCRRLSDQVRVLEHRLSADLGQQVWQRTGIGAPADIDSLQARILDLEQPEPRETALARQPEPAPAGQPADRRQCQPGRPTTIWHMFEPPQVTALARAPERVRARPAR